MKIEFNEEDVQSISRITVVNAYGRKLEMWNVKIDKMDVQDDGRTLKIFLSERIDKGE